MKLMKSKVKIPNLRVDKNLKKEHLVQMIIEQSLIINEDNYYVEFVKYFQHKCTSTVFTDPNSSLFRKIIITNKLLIFIFYIYIRITKNSRVIFE